MEGQPVEGYYDTQWLAGVWSTEAKVEGFMLKDTWHWGRDNNVVYDPLAKRSRTHCM